MSGGRKSWFRAAAKAFEAIDMRHDVTIRTLPRGSGAVYFIARASFAPQPAGLIGAHGILPARNSIPSFGEKAWQRREPRGMYFPAVSLK